MDEKKFLELLQKEEGKMLIRKLASQEKMSRWPKLFGSLAAAAVVLIVLFVSVPDVREVSFPTSKVELSKLPRIVEVNKELPVPNGVLTVDQLVLAPTQAVLKLSYLGRERGPDLLINYETKLLSPEGPVESRGGDSGGRPRGDRWEKEYELRFQPLDPVPPSLELRLAGTLYRQGETRIPLNNEPVGTAPDGRKVFLDNFVQQGRVGQGKIRYAIDEDNLRPFELLQWKVADDRGGLHPIIPLLEDKVKKTATPPSIAPRYSEVRIKWQLPAGRKAVALVNSGCWEFVNDLGRVTMEIPKK